MIYDNQGMKYDTVYMNKSNIDFDLVAHILHQIDLC